MPFRLVPPKAGRWAHYRVRGTEFGVYLDKSVGTSSKREAQQILAHWREEAKRQSVLKPSTEPEVTFADAALSYLQAGRSRLFVAPCLQFFGTVPIRNIDQRMVDAAAVALYPTGKPSTRNRQVYTPIVAILRHAGLNPSIRRPKGASGERRVAWLQPEEAFRLLEASRGVDDRLGALVCFLLYTGVRLSEALRLEWKDVDLERQTATIGRTKNGSPVTVHINNTVAAALGALPRLRGRVFYYTKSGRLYNLYGEAQRRSGVILASRSAFHCLRHTHITWRRLYAGQDTTALLEVGLHKSPRMVERYTHLDLSEEAKKSDLLPTPPSTQ